MNDHNQDQTKQQIESHQKEEEKETLQQIEQMEQITQDKRYDEWISQSVNLRTHKGGTAENDLYIDIEFFCYHSEIHQLKEYQLVIHSPYLKRQRYPMQRIDQSIIYTNVSIPKSELFKCPEIKYQYSGRGDYVEYNTDDIKRIPKIFNQITKIFDTPIVFRNFSNIRSKETKKGPGGHTSILTNYFDFFARKFIETRNLFSSSQMFSDLFKFYDIYGFQLHFKQLFETLLWLLQSDKINQELFIYVFEVLSFAFRKVKSNISLEQAQIAFDQLLIKILHFSRQGTLVQVYNSITNEYNPEFFVDGIKRIINWQPLIGLQFIQEINIIPDKSQFFKQVQDKDSLVSKIEFISSQIEIQLSSKCDPQLKTYLIEMLLASIKTFYELSSCVEKFLLYFTKGQLQSKVQQLKKWYDSRELQKFLIDRIDKILNIQELLDVFINDLESLIIEQVKNQSSEFLHKLNQSAYILTPQLMLRISTKITNQSKNAFKQLLAISLSCKDIVYTHEDYLQIQLQLCQNLIHHKETLVSLYHLAKECWQLTESLSKEIILQELIVEYKPQEAKNLVLNYLEGCFTYYPFKVTMSQIEQFFKQQDLEHDLLKVFIRKFHNDIDSNIHNLNEIYNVLCSIFDINYQIISPQAEPLAQLLFKKLITLYNEIDLQKVFEDDIMLRIIRIGQRNQFKYQFTQVLKNHIHTFQESVNHMDITLRDVEKFLLQEKKNYFSIVTLCSNNLYKHEQIEKLKQICQDYSERLRKYESYLTWFKHLQGKVDYQQYEKNLIKIQKDRLNIPCKQIQDPSYFKYFDNCKTIDILYQMNESKLFFNIFIDSFKTINLDNQQQEEQKVNSDEDLMEQSAFNDNMEELDDSNIFQQNIPNQAQFNEKDFDQYVIKNIINGKALQHYQVLINYPNQEITYDIVQNYWKTINSDNVIYELERINILLNKRTQFSQQLIVNLQLYCQIKQYYEDAFVLQDFEFLATKANVHLDQDYLHYQQFVKFYKELQNNITLTVIALNITYVKRKIENLKQNNVDLGLFVEICRSKELFDFVQESQGQNFNDLYERLDDTQFLTTTTISDMNAVSNFFNKLNNKIIENRLYGLTFENLVLLINEQMKQQLREDKQFTAKLKNCMSNLPSLKNINNALNVSENTLKIVSELLQNGSIKFFLSNEKYDYMMDKYNNDQINQHSSRAILLQHTKSGAEQNQSQNEGDVEMIDVQEQEKAMALKKQVEIFVQMVTLTQDIKQILTELYLYGHLEYQKYEVEYQIQQEDIVEQLQQLKLLLDELLSEWKELLQKIREKHYYLTYIPNRKIKQLIDFFIKPTPKTLKSIKSIFKFININVKENDLMKIDPIISLLNVKEQLEQVGFKLTEIFSNMPEKEQMLFDLKSKNLKEHVIKPGKAQFFRVMNEYDMVKSIISIYYLVGYYPLSSEIYFCTKQTKFHEIECFLLRAIMSPNYFKRQKMFILADFQNLSLSIQVDCYNLLKQLEEDNQQQKYLLIVLFQSNDRKNDNSIEELQGREIFGAFIDERNIHKFFLDFRNVEIITSDTVGLGKSHYIKQQINEVKQAKFVRIPIFGDFNREKFVKLHKEKQINQFNVIGIHYDIYPTQNESLNIILFETLILKCIRNGDNKIYHIPQNATFYLEISQALMKDYDRNKYYFKLFNNNSFSWDINRLEIDENIDSDIQILCRHIQILESEEKFSVTKLIEEPVLIEQQICQLLLQKYCLQGLKRPNFYILNSFIAFAADQIRRMTYSPYFNSDVMLKEQFNNQGIPFYRQIVEIIVTLSKKLSEVEVSQKEQDKAIQDIPLEEQQVHLLQDMKWDKTSALFIMFNDSLTITPIFKEQSQLPKCITDYFTHYHKFKNEIKATNELTQLQILEKIARMCGKDSQENFELFQLQVIEDKIAFTRDNFLKMALIYLRIRCRQPVIIMGETGVGKTAVIRCLSHLLSYNFQILNMHAGITEQQIIDFVKIAEGISIFDNSKVILFFDEINTNYNVSGLLKEIVIDRHLLGNPISDNICIVAACNPYQLKSEQMLNNVLTAGIKHANMDKNISKLVYTVQPLPESIFSFIWDYGSLNKAEEYTYIQKIISHMNDDINKAISDYNVDFIARSVFQAQCFIREVDAKWSVSLRDVARFSLLYKFFLMNNARTYREIHDYYNNYKYGSYSNSERAFVLSLAFCYLFRIDKKEQRMNFIRQILKDKKTSLNLLPKSFNEILEDEYDRYLSNMEIPVGIGKNTALKENVFVILTCILNKIPLFITGKPGSTKTLAINLVTKSMKGNSSSNQFFKNLPAVLCFNYQGSVQSTSAGIERVFERAIKCQEGISKEKSNTIVLVIIDEIGLAEISPYNPLKVLHSLLEPPKVAVVGISNWALDASKMNRAINLLRPDPTLFDLEESAESISKEVNKENEQKHHIFKNQFLHELVKSYDEYYKNQQFENFHGLRDFYSMIQQVCMNLTNINEQNIRTVLKAMERNFGGTDEDGMQRMLYFMKKYFNNSRDLNNFIPQSSEDLIKANLADYNARHLMVITDSQENNTLNFIERYFQETNKESRIFYGSDFQEDVQEQAAYEQINDIILCMEQGIYCVILNQNHIYQSFYDMLNQNYQIIGNQRFCKVAIGPDSSRCLVHPEFKCVILVDKGQVKKLDPPLLNRFEKQFYSEFTNVSDDNKRIIDDICVWINSFSKVGPFDSSDMVPMINLNSITSLVLFLKEVNMNHDEKVRVCKNKIIELSTMSSIIRASDSECEDREEWINIYQNQQHHYSIQDLLKYYQKNWREEIFFNEKDKGFNLVVYTYSALLTEMFREYNMNFIKIEGPIFLSNIHSKREFQTKIESFFSSKSSNDLLLVYADTLQDSVTRISLCKNIINSQRAKYIKDHEKQKNVCFIIRISEQYDASVCFCKGWKEYFIDVLNGYGNSQISLQQLNDMNFTQMINDDNSFQYLVQTCITTIMSKIRYNLNEDLIIKRMNSIRKLLQRDDFQQQCREYFVHLVQQYERDYELFTSNWQLIVAHDKIEMQSNLSFHSAGIEFFKKLIIKHLSFIIQLMENDGVITSYLNEKYLEFAYFTFQQRFEKIYSKNVKFQENYQLKASSNFITFPYAQLIHDSINKLKGPFIRRAKEDQELLILMKSEKKIEQERLIDYDDSIRQMLNELQEQSTACLPKTIIDFDILFSGTEDYLNDFSDILEKNKNDKNYHILINRIIRIILRNNITDITTIYGVYWLNEDLINNIYNLIDNNKSVIRVGEFLDSLERSINKNENNRQIKCLTRFQIIPALIQAIYDQFIPSEFVMQEFQKQNLDWQTVVENILKYLSDIESFQDNEEFKKLEFLVSYSKNYVKPFNLDQLLLELISAQITDIFDPQQVITTVLSLQSEGGEECNNIDTNKTLFTFIFDYLEDQFEVMNIKGKIIEHIEFSMTLIFNAIGTFENVLDNKILALFHSVINRIFDHAYQFNEQSFISTDQDYTIVLAQNPVLNQLSESLMQQGEGFSIQHELFLIISDAIETQIQKLENQENTQIDLNNRNNVHKLQNAIENKIFNTEIPILERLLAFAFFKFITKKSIGLLLEFRNQQIQESNSVIQYLNAYFDQNDYEITHPLMIYIIKILTQAVPLNQVTQDFAIQLPWIRKLGISQQQSFYKILLDQQLSQELLNSLDNRQFIRQKLQEGQNDRNIKFSLYMLLLQQHYLNRKIDNLGLSNELIIQCQENIGKDFFRAFIGRNISEQVQQLINSSPHLCEFITYTICAALSCDQQSLIYTILNNPQDLQQIFIPFMANVRQDFQYQSLFRTDPSFVRYSCRNCGEIVCVTDCGQLANHRGAGTGDTRCAGCGRGVGYSHQDNTQRIDNQHVTKQTLNTENEAVRSYIILDPQENEQLELRGLNNTVRKLGFIVVHTLLYAGLLFGREQQKTLITNLVLSPRIVNNLQQLSAHQKQTEALRFVRSQIEFNWNKLKQDYQINDERVQVIMQHVVKQMFSQSTNNNQRMTVLQNVLGRRQFETYFAQYCVPNVVDNFASFFQSVQTTKLKHPLEAHINETVVILDQSEEQINKYLYNHLKIQNVITFNNFKQTIQTQNTIESKFLRLVNDSMEGLQNINLIQPLIKWANYVLTKFSGKITFEDAYNESIDTILRRVPQDEQEMARKLFKNFQEAWNIIAGMDIREGCDTIRIHKIDCLSTKFLNCCITKSNKDSPGLNFYLVLKSLADKQNFFLKSVKENIDLEVVNETPLLRLKKEQIIMHEVDREKLELLVKRNSYCSLNYGQGRNIEYNINKIFKVLKDQLLHDKTIINVDKEDINFQFQNVGNPYFQIEEIDEKIPQEISLDSLRIVHSLNTTEDKTQLLNDIKTAMNFLSQTGGEPDAALIIYMKPFRLGRFYREIGSGIKLKHIIHLYETLEIELCDILIQKTNPKYTTLLSQSEEKILINIIKQNLAQIKVVKNGLARLCIRQLSYSQDISDQQALFPYLFDDFNVNLFGIRAPNLDLERLKQQFTLSTISIGNALAAYDVFKRIDDERENEIQRQQEEEEKRREINQQRIEESKQKENEDEAIKDFLPKQEVQPKKVIITNLKTAQFSLLSSIQRKYPKKK